MAYLVRNLKLAKISSSLTSQIYRKISYPKFRSQGSCAAESEDGMVDFQGFQKWSNGGGLFHRSASIDPAAVVEIGAVIHPLATLCANVHVGSGGVVGPNVVVGHSTRLGYNVSLSNCSIGDSCVIHNGVCIGQDGSFCKNRKSCLIGANTCVDKGSWRDTMIGDYTKIDNLVQIAHNVIIGKSCILCGQVGIAGGRVAVRDHVSIVSKVRLAANSCVTKDIMDPGDYGGFPSVPVQKWRRQVAAQQLFSFKKDIKSP